MHPQPKFSLFIFLLMLVSLFTGVPALATTHIISPEDHSVYIDQRDPDINKSDKSGILTASEINENARIVIHFDLSGWGADSIFQAKLYLYHYRGGYYTDSRAINVYPLTSAFDEFTATWNFPWAIPGGDYDTSVSASADVPEEWENWVAWDVTELLMNRWNNIANCGFLLKDPVEDTPFDGPYVRFRSHRHLGEFPEEVPYLEISTEPTGVGDINAEAMPHSFWLGQNFPNPFNSSTLFEFELTKTAWVNLDIYNIRGERVKTLLDAMKQTGTYLAEWDATNQSGKPISSGIYLYQLRTKGFSETKRLLYLK